MANYGLANGNFDIDVSDGEVRYKTYVNCKDMKELPEQIIKDNPELEAFETFDDFYNAIVAAL